MSVAPTQDGVRTASQVVADRVCLGCGCVCDDVEVVAQAGGGVQTTLTCTLGQAWFHQPLAANLPAASLAGKSTSVQDAVDRAASILTAARLPLVCGLAGTTCETQRVAVAIADRIGGCVDVSAFTEHHQRKAALPEIGQVTCTLGEVRNRADLVVFWGCDPTATHPRHGERFSIDTSGMFTQNGRAGRHVVVVDTQATATAALADSFLRVGPDSDFEVLWLLRGLVRGVAPDLTSRQPSGVPIGAWQQLADRMKSCRFGVLFFGERVDALAAFSLVRDLNTHTRFYGQALHHNDNAVGAEYVLAWQTGYPNAVHLGRGFPRSCGSEFLTHEMLARGEPDAILIVRGDPWATLQGSAREHLARIPSVSLSPNDSATVAFTTSLDGLHTTGTVCRLDGVPLSVRPVLSSPFPSAQDILTRIELRIRQLQSTADEGLRDAT